MIEIMKFFIYYFKKIKKKYLFINSIFILSKLYFKINIK